MRALSESLFLTPATGRRPVTWELILHRGRHGFGFRKPLGQGSGELLDPWGPERTHIGLSSWGCGWWDGQGKWSSIILPYINQTGAFFPSLYCPRTINNRSIFLRIKLHTAILITATAHWIHAVPSQQSEVILVIMESKHDITNPYWTKPDVLVQEGC